MEKVVHTVLPVWIADKIVVTFITTAFESEAFTIIRAFLTVMTGVHWDGQLHKTVINIENQCFNSHVAVLPLLTWLNTYRPKIEYRAFRQIS